jgi:hypothetical protein
LGKKGKEEEMGLIIIEIVIKRFQIKSAKKSDIRYSTQFHKFLIKSLIYKD